MTMHPLTEKFAALRAAVLVTELAAADALREAKGIHGTGPTVRYDYRGWTITSHGTYVEAAMPDTAGDDADYYDRAVRVSLGASETVADIASAAQLIAACERMERRIDATY